MPLAENEEQAVSKGLSFAIDASGLDAMHPIRTA